MSIKEQQGRNEVKRKQEKKVVDEYALNFFVLPKSVCCSQRTKLCVYK